MNSPGFFLIRWFNGLSSCKMRNEGETTKIALVLLFQQVKEVEPNVISLIFRTEPVNYFYYFSFLSYKRLSFFSGEVSAFERGKFIKTTNFVCLVFSIQI